MYEHSQWANRRLLESLTANQTGNRKTNQLIAHIVQSELVWMKRLQGNDSNTIELWPELEPEQCMIIAESNASVYNAYLASIHPNELDTILTYRNQTVKQFETSVRDILTHVAMHGQYHRGQINAILKSEGKDLMNVDMIAYVREISK